MDAKLTAVLKKARRTGARTFVDVVSPYRQSWDFLRRALPWTDFFHCNSDEAADPAGEADYRGLEKHPGLRFGLRGGLLFRRRHHGRGFRGKGVTPGAPSRPRRRPRDHRHSALIR